MQILSIVINQGRVYCKLSIISPMLPHTFINDAKVGINSMKSNVMKLYSSRIFDRMTSFAFPLSGGHKPTIFNISRFILIAHFKSVTRSR